MMERLWFVVHRYVGFWFLRLSHSNGKTKRSNPFKAFACRWCQSWCNLLPYSFSHWFISTTEQKIYKHIFIFLFPLPVLHVAGTETPEPNAHSVFTHTWQYNLIVIVMTACRGRPAFGWGVSVNSSLTSDGSGPGNHMQVVFFFIGLIPWKWLDSLFYVIWRGGPSPQAVTSASLFHLGPKVSSSCIQAAPE